MSVKMRALSTFLGVEGLIKKGQPFEVRDAARADYLESVHYAERADAESRSYATQTTAPSNTQVVAPSFTSVKGPENTPTQEPEQLKETAPTEKTVAELKKEAKALKITGYSSMNKGELQEAIQKKTEEEK